MRPDEREVVRRLGLHLGLPFSGRMSESFLAEFVGSSLLSFDPETPVLFCIQAIARKQTALLSVEAVRHFDIIEKVGMVDAISYYCSRIPSDLDASSFLTFLIYEKHMNTESFSIKSDSNTTSWSERREVSNDTTTAGYALQSCPSNRFQNIYSGERPKGFFSSRPWLMQFFIEAPENQSKQFTDKWWPLIVPASSNYLDTGDLNTKTRAVRLVKSLASRHKAKLQLTGLIPVFENSIQPCLSFLPPLVEPSKTKLIHRLALECLCESVNTYDDCEQIKRNKRLNFLAIEGCSKPFAHTDGKVELLLYFLESLRWFVGEKLQSLTVIQLRGMVQILNQILTDPFIGFSPALITSACETMEIIIQWTWPRIECHRYAMALGLAKAQALDTNAFKMLRFSAEEKAQSNTAITTQPGFENQAIKSD